MVKKQELTTILACLLDLRCYRSIAYFTGHFFILKLSCYSFLVDMASINCNEKANCENCGTQIRRSNFKRNRR